MRNGFCMLQYKARCIYMNEQLVKDLMACEEVEALVLGGSRATGTFDKTSDYDFYVYLNQEFTEEKRRQVIDKYVSYMEYSNRFWELEDDGTFNDGIDVEFIYRDLDDIDQMLENTVINKNVGHGYSTCFIDNLLKSKIVFDKNGRVQALKDKYQEALTDDFFNKVIEYNFPIMLDKMPSMYYQIEKAMKRNDLFSINHRTTAYFEMYFDIIFALNKETHPGEKRLLKLTAELNKTPNNMVEDVTEYFTLLGSDNKKALTKLEEITIQLHQLLEQNGFHYAMRSYR